MIRRAQGDEPHSDARLCSESPPRAIRFGARQNMTTKSPILHQEKRVSRSLAEDCSALNDPLSFVFIFFSYHMNER